MGTAIRIILIIVIAWYVIRIIDRYILPGLFGRQSRKTPPPGSREKKFRKSTRQGDVTITDFGKRSKNVNTDDNDYVDYEEVD
jgi:hypothetical protein